jgi:hypothetical protein
LLRGLVQQNLDEFAGANIETENQAAAATAAAGGNELDDLFDDYADDVDAIDDDEDFYDSYDEYDGEDEELGGIGEKDEDSAAPVATDQPTKDATDGAPTETAETQSSTPRVAATTTEPVAVPDKKQNQER